ncbi:MAG TPA: alpha/beta hydrolase, partial [Candidatus Saccharimonadales bacterium]|nr:alpha/beta hydrolase [Candidatus Saccharimonadales bacterium]
MEKALPDYPVAVEHDRQYRVGDKDALLDVYMPKDAVREHKSLPVVVWTHGGAWLSGDKTNDVPYFKRLANEGFVVVAINYSLAPGKTYPTAVHQLNAALRYVDTNVASFAGNPNQILLAGDSAGAQLSSQVAALTTSPEYAEEV